MPSLIFFVKLIEVIFFRNLDFVDDILCCLEITVHHILLSFIVNFIGMILLCWRTVRRSAQFRRLVKTVIVWRQTWIWRQILRRRAQRLGRFIFATLLSSWLKFVRARDHYLLPMRSNYLLWWRILGRFSQNTIFWSFLTFLWIFTLRFRLLTFLI